MPKMYAVNATCQVEELAVQLRNFKAAKDHRLLSFATQMALCANDPERKAKLQERALLSKLQVGCQYNEC